MKKFITIKDIALRAGVSINTVSRALNNKPDISPQTKQKVLQAAIANTSLKQKMAS